MLDFEEVKRFLDKKIKNNPLVKGCLDTITREEVVFRKGIIKSRIELLSLYDFRLKNAKKYRIDIFLKEELDSWELGLDNLRKSEAEIMLLNSIRTSNRCYLLFWNNDSFELEAIFWLSNKQLTAMDKNDNI
ncbi:hypothetical protein LVD17_05530 [Fulvivirga ulvae]|uniref:hypothetical protein n=1 Tax=Fulvivirga ulvae TaxID=2904245 RepID=UPI001F36E7DA|nr:hypothetical protein [Fulvivirga ulvae]UII33284.1 hypothetical protein LVD17_05530 [Fulvivirga ulvae]